LLPLQRRIREEFQELQEESQVLAPNILNIKSIDPESREVGTPDFHLILGAAQLFRIANLNYLLSRTDCKFNVINNSLLRMITTLNSKSLLFSQIKIKDTSFHYDIASSACKLVSRKIVANLPKSEV